MLVRIIVLCALFCLVCGRDINIDSKTEGRRIFDETRQASPAIWRQFENVTVIAPSNELIGKVVVTDMRPEKDGDAQIVDGGEGKKSVTIELKSPTVLRGYEFHIEVYSVPETVSTDAEEHSSPDDVNISSEDDNETEVPSNVTTENVPDTGDEDVKVDNFRPARETENKNNMETESPEINTSTNSYDMSTNTAVDNSITTDQDLTTELPENLIEDAPASVITDLDDKIRPARESVINTPTYPLDSAVTESDNIAAENISNDDSTTEVYVTTKSYDKPSTFVPTAFVNSKNIPDFDSLSILDYIKSKEAVRPNRDAQDNSFETSSVTTERSLESDENIDTTTLAEEVATLNPLVDDTVDLVPPEVDASYSTGFENSLDTTENTIVTSPLYENIPRSGRGINFDDSINNAEYQTAVPTTTIDITTETSIDKEQFQNTLDSRNEVEDNTHDINTSEQTLQNTEMPDKNENGKIFLDAEQPSSNVIILNTKQLVTKGDSNKFMYALPIVLLISSENDIPTIKIVADYSTVPENAPPVAPLDQPQDQNEYDDKSQKTDIDFRPSEDYSQ